jgi:dipeptidyl-peptidase-4
LKIKTLIFLLTIVPLIHGVELTLENIYKNGTFQTNGLGRWKWIPESDDILIYQKAQGDSVNSFLRVKLNSGDTTAYISSDKLKYNNKSFQVSSYSYNRDGTKILLLTNRDNIWRHSFTGKYFVYDLISEEVIQISDENSQLRNVKFSLDGKKISYVKEDNNLYVFDLKTLREKRLTRDGSETILNGHFGWLYEEEFSGYDAYRWSPDSRYIFFFQEDQSNVKKFHWLDEREQYPKLGTIYYPKAGEENPKMKLGIIHVRSGRIKWLYDDGEKDVYYPKAVWQKEKIIVFRLNRKQNLLDLLRFDPQIGKKEILLTERDSCWVDVHDNIRILKDGSFIWTSERTGFNHIYHFDRNGILINQLTNGKWEVRKIIDVDEKTNLIFFTATKVSELENHLFSVSLDGGEINRLTQKSGWHSISISSTKSIMIDSWSDVRTPATSLLIKINGEYIKTLSSPDMSIFDGINWTYPELVSVQTSDGVLLNGKITLPWDFDESKKYPILVNTYGLAGSQMVTNRWRGRGFLWHQYMAKNGFIIFSMDNRQTGGRGKAFKNLGYGDLGKWLIHDHIEGIKFLGKYSFADTSRVGIWGWSGGGYATALALTKGAEYFDVGVAVASVTDWRLYDTAYTERFMGLLSENEAGYDSASVFSYIDRFKGELLLIHGTGDDNVHAQNSIQLVNKFVKAGKHVDTMFYPSRNHGIYGGNASFHLRQLMTDYFLKNL